MNRSEVRQQQQILWKEVRQLGLQAKLAIIQQQRVELQLLEHRLRELLTRRPAGRPRKNGSPAGEQTRLFDTTADTTADIPADTKKKRRRRRRGTS